VRVATPAATPVARAPQSGWRFDIRRAPRAAAPSQAPSSTVQSRYAALFASSESFAAADAQQADALFGGAPPPSLRSTPLASPRAPRGPRQSAPSGSKRSSPRSFSSVASSSSTMR
jgi:hypothetical protein